jgi:alpha-ribazole phosphatase
MLIYLIRHARPEGVEGVCYGRRDVAVTAAATAQAARGVRAQLPAAVLETAPLYTSPLTRCTQLARELAAVRLPFIASADLLELDFGSWEGAAWNDIPRAELERWAQDPWRYAPGGAESACSVAARFRNWVTSLRDARLQTVVAVTHAGIIRTALAADSPDPRRLSLAIPYGSVHQLRVDEHSFAKPERALS